MAVSETLPAVAAMAPPLVISSVNMAEMSLALSTAAVPLTPVGVLAAEHLSSLVPPQALVLYRQHAMPKNPATGLSRTKQL